MEIKQIKYIGEQAISYLVEKCKATFALINHTHTAEEVGADAKGSSSAALALAEQYTDEQIGNHTHSWNELEDKPFYEEEAVETPVFENVTASWSKGERPGVSLANAITINSGAKYKIVCTSTLLGTTATETTTVIAENSRSLSFTMQGYSASISASAVVLESYDLGGSFDISLYEVQCGIVTLDEKFIPSTIARASDVETALSSKADTDHTHDDIYYTETEVDNLLANINTTIDGITSGDTVVENATHSSTADTAASADSAKEAEHATSADTSKEADHATSADEATHAVSADEATKATQDASGNVITDTYETKTDASAKLTEAKEYTDTAVANLVNSAPETLDTLGELATAFSENQEVVEALDAAIANKVDVAQGTENAGKILAIDEEGIVIPSNAPEAVDIVYHENEKVLEFVTKTQLPGNVGVDSTLTVSGDAADAKAVGDKFAELEVLIESGTGNSGVSGNGVSNWSQNDSEGEGYIIDRPFYMTREPSETTSVVEILPETTFEISSDGGYQGEDTYGITSFEIGKTYTVTFNSTTYDNVICGTIEGIAALGSLGFSFDDYPFIIAAFNNMFLIIAPTMSGASCTVSISISSTIIDLGEMYFESKYAPHLQSDWENDDKASINYIKNKPFGTQMCESVIANGTMSFEEVDATLHLYAAMGAASDLIEKNKTYDVDFDTETYKELVVKEYNGTPYIGGDISADGESCDFSTYPFIIDTQDGGSSISLIVRTNLTDTSHNIKVVGYGEEITKLPEQYQNQANWEELDDTRGTYIANKPFGELYNGETEVINGGTDLTLGETDYAGVYYIDGVSSERMIEGNKYKVTIGDIVYDNLVCYADATTGYPTIGAGYREVLSEAREYPFFFGHMSSSGTNVSFVISNHDGSAISFSIEKYVIGTKQIDEQYIPDTIMRATDTIPKWNGYSLAVVTELPETPDETTFYVILES